MATAPDPASEGVLHCIVFSKDRAFQLDQLLRSCDEFLRVEGLAELRVSVLFRAEEGPCGGARSYAEVHQRHPAVQFVPETKGRFHEHVRDLVSWRSATSQAHPHFLMFLVDDLIFHDAVPCGTFCDLLRSRDDVFCVQPKLSPGVRWSHSSSGPCRQPKSFQVWIGRRGKRDDGLGPMRRILGTTSLGGEIGREEDAQDCQAVAGDVHHTARDARLPPPLLLLFSRGTGSGDWDYTWDLCGGCYRTEDAELVLSAMIECRGVPEKSMSNPNRLEDNGHKTIRTLLRRTRASPAASPTSADVLCDVLSRRQVVAAMNRPVLAVVTVNRVQGVFKVPVYEGVPQSSLEELETLRLRGGELDLAAYYRRRFEYSSVHVGDLLLPPGNAVEQGARTQEGGDHQFPRAALAAPAAEALVGDPDSAREASSSSSSASTSPGAPGDSLDITVLLPVHNGASFLRAALTSVLEGLSRSGRRGEVLVIDDGSTDESPHVARDFAALDARVRVVQSEHAGLAVALNQGLIAARGAVVARMDSDDLCAPWRLADQLDYLAEQPQVHCIGGGLVPFGSAADPVVSGEPEHRPFQAVLHPVSPALVRWGLCFSCCMAHPTAMFRRSVVLSAGGYREDLPCGVEDYDLWLRLAWQRPEEAPGRVGLQETQEVRPFFGGGVANLPEVVLFYRRHAGNSSSRDPQRRSQAATEACRRALERVLEQPLSLTHVATMRAPAAGKHVDDFRGAARLLLSLEKAACSGAAEVDRRDVELIREDATKRLGEIAVTAMAQHAAEAVGVWQMWADRSPEAQIAMLRGLLQS
mmetsp:Transcript_819/g.2625  ORF Transcript_819/g.2625 Transcript_819/m.2625 type:complete len:809 (-) Transcript_819:13-2439(-)